MAPLTKNSFLKHSSMKMPYIGLGTMQIKAEEMDTALNAAIDAGYRHFDAAYRYYNEVDIGRSLKKIFDSGKIKREELFIVTKLPANGNRREDVEFFLKKSLEDLQLDYVDLYLVHSPIGFKRIENPHGRDNYNELELDMETDLVDIWRGMEDQVDAGRAKYIGISKFNSKQIQQILNNCRIKPANNQIEMHIYLQERELVSFCHDNGITVTAFSPFGSPAIISNLSESQRDGSQPLNDPVVKEIANRYNKQPTQIMLRFLVECGVNIIPKSSNPTRIQQNIDVFDFELTKEDFDKIRSLDRGEDGRIFGKKFFAKSVDHPQYPFPK